MNSGLRERKDCPTTRSVDSRTLRAAVGVTVTLVTFALDPALPVLLRPDGTVQVGWDPRRAVLVRPPRGLTCAGLATVLRALSVPMTPGDLHRLALSHGLGDEAGFDDLLAGLVAAGVVHQRHRPRGGRALSIRVHGAGRCQSLWQRDFGAPVPGWGCPAMAMPRAHPPGWIWWCWPIPWPRIRACYAICTPPGCRICRCGYATAPAWSARW